MACDCSSCPLRWKLLTAEIAKKKKRPEEPKGNLWAIMMGDHEKMAIVKR